MKKMKIKMSFPFRFRLLGYDGSGLEAKINLQKFSATSKNQRCIKMCYTFVPLKLLK